MSDAGFESDTDALYLQQRTLLSIMSDASADEWLMDLGGCPGWTVHDIRLHLGLTLASFVDRGSLADVRGLPAERAKDDAQKDDGLRNISVAFLGDPA